MLKLGAIGYDSRGMRNWFLDLLRYERVRFFGYVRGRLFLGVLWGSRAGGREWTLARCTEIDELAEFRRAKVRQERAEEARHA